MKVLSALFKYNASSVLLVAQRGPLFYQSCHLSAQAVHRSPFGDAAKLVQHLNYHSRHQAGYHAHSENDKTYI